MIGFSVLFGADTFTDTKTGLTWQNNSASESVKMNWNEAEEYCKDLKLDGYSDWKLPSIKELQSIVDINNDPAIKNGLNALLYGVWSSTMYPWQTGLNNAWIVYFNGGTTSNASKLDKRYVRCVRGRQ